MAVYGSRVLVFSASALLGAVTLAACSSASEDSKRALGECHFPANDRGVAEVSVPPAKALSGEVNLTLVTNQGDIPLLLDASKAPCTVTAIAHLAEQGYFDDSICHRLTTSGIYVLQCGDPSGTGRGGPGFEFADEYPVGESTSKDLYTAGTVAMANSGPDTNGSQFFLNYEDSPLSPAYTIFGEITAPGMETLRTIAARGAALRVGDGPPAEEVRIVKAVLG